MRVENALPLGIQQLGPVGFLRISTVDSSSKWPQNSVGVAITRQNWFISHYISKIVMGICWSHADYTHSMSVFKQIVHNHLVLLIPRLAD